MEDCREAMAFEEDAWAEPGIFLAPLSFWVECGYLNFL